GPGVEVAAGGYGGVQVVVQQPADRGIRFGRVLTGRQGAGVLTQQVVQLAAAGGGLGDQVVVIQLIKAAPGGGQAGVIERRRRVSVQAGAGNQASVAEQPLQVPGEVGVGQVERGGDRQVLRVHHGQPVPRRGQLVG